MAAWVLTDNLIRLTEECNILGPDRDKKSDGSVGDQDHQAGRSGHNPDKTGNAEYKDGDSKNEVRAKDIDSSGPWLYGQSMETIVQHLVMRARRGDYIPLRYIIYKGRIWRKTNGWKTEKYTGPSSHTEHAHFSGDYSQKADEYRNFNYGIATLGKPEDSMGFIDNQAEFNAAFEAALDKFLTDKANKQSVANALLDSLLGNGAYPQRTVRNLLNELYGIRDVWIADTKGKDPKYSYVTPNTPIAKLLQVAPTLVEFIGGEASRDAQDAARDAALQASIDALTQLVTEGDGATLTQEQFTELKNSILEKVAEAGEDAADAAADKLNRIADALDNAGEALSAAGDEATPDQQ